MKNKRWIYLLPIAACLVVFYAYKAIDLSRTDTKPPEISISEAALQISVQDPADALLMGVSAKDSTDGDVSDSLVVESIRLLDSDGTASVSYAAFDHAGNVARAERQIRYSDYKSPHFSLNAPLVFTQGSSVDVLRLIHASDLLDGDISHRIRTTNLSETSISAVGTSNVEFRITNSLGDTVKLVLPVEVCVSGAYSAKLTLTDYLIYLEPGAPFDVQSYLGSYTLGTEVTSLENGLPQNYNLETTGTVDTAIPGIYTVAYKVTYAGPNQSHTGYSKLIVIVEG